MRIRKEKLWVCFSKNVEIRAKSVRRIYALSVCVRIQMLPLQLILYQLKCRMSFDAHLQSLKLVYSSCEIPSLMTMKNEAHVHTASDSHISSNVG